MISRHSPSTYAWCGLVIFLFTVTAAGQLSINPSTVNFGSVQVGTSVSHSVVLTNAGSESLTIFQAKVFGTAFSVSGLGTPLTLAPEQTATFAATFLPQAGVSFSGSVSLEYSEPNERHRRTAALALVGTGAGPQAGDPLSTLALNPNSITFGNVTVGSSLHASGTLTNSGGSSLTVSQATLSGTSFSISGLTLPLILGAGQSAAFSITFTPQSTGSISGNVLFSSNASDPTLNLPLSGTGVSQGTLTASPSSLAFGNVQVGSNAGLSETLTNSGGSNLTISAATASGAGFSLSGLSLPITLTSGQSTSFTILFTPAASGAVSGSLNITSTGSDSNLSIPLSGTGVTQGALAANPPSLAFGNVQAGNSSSLSEALTNTGGSSVTISQANLNGAMFSISGLTLPITLAPNQSVTFTATFAPSTAGAASGSLSVLSNGSDSTLTIPMSGTGTAAGTLAVSPTSLSFGNVVVGSSSALNGSLTASGAAVTVQPATPSNSEFVLSGISLPLTISAGQSATFTVTFTPQSSGSASASLSFPSDAANSPTVQSMTGTGTAPIQHTVDLTWNPSTGAAGYNVYRGAASGGPYTMINNSLDPTATYTDSTVVSGQTYYYVVTDLDGELVESGYSNQVQAVIPNP